MIFFPVRLLFRVIPHRQCLSQVYKWVPVNLMLGVKMRWINRNTPSRLIEKPQISASLMDHLVRFADFTCFLLTPSFEKLTLESELVKGQLILVLALSNSHSARLHMYLVHGVVV